MIYLPERLCLLVPVSEYNARRCCVCVHLPDDNKWTNQNREALPNISKNSHLN